jgi:signal transduction histidine kinase
LNPKELINDSLSLLEYRISLTKINVTKKFSKQDVYVKIDRNQFQQVLFNVLTNAIEALSKGGRIIVAISKKCQEEFFNNKPACLIEISDNGEGISRSNLLKLFKPFFTTKRKKKGTGLGLAISQTIIKNYRGLLTVESEAKKGTKVTIILPAA